MDTSICAAIGKRAVVQFCYEGVTRTVEPHCFGVSTAGHKVLRGYQTGGYSQSGKRIGWKLFEVSKISGWQETEFTFGKNRPGYTSRDSAMKTVKCHV